MSQLALYRSWRPQTFDEVVAQKQVVYPLKQAIINEDIGHAYLFSGTRGTGKTSLAKIFAKAVNCLDPDEGNPCNKCEVCEGILNGSLLDVMEIDAASHNSVDNIRRITDEVLFMPSRARYKVYIIDEVHMLSQGAFNALLKTLEEPPSHVVFILATTEPQRIPATILSRCQRFEFRRIPLEDILERLRNIATNDGIQISEEALYTIARLGDGALRDAISLLDQCQSGKQGEISHDDVLEIAGVVKDDFLIDFTSALFEADLNHILHSIDELQMSGRDIQRFLQDFLRFLRDLLVLRMSGNNDDLLQYSASDLNKLRHLAQKAGHFNIISMMNRLSKLNNEMRWSSDPKTSLELALIEELSRLELVDIPKVDVQKTDQVTPVLKPDIPSSLEHEVAPTREHEVAPTLEYKEKQSPPPLEAPEPNPADFIPAETLGDEESQSDVASPVKQEQWETTLDTLRAKGRYDLVMLLKPAQIFIKDDHVDVVYNEAQIAHCNAMRTPDNKEALHQAVQESGITNPKVTLSIAGEQAEHSKNPVGNVNPEEPIWVQKLRYGSEKLGLDYKETHINDVKEEPRPFYEFPQTDNPPTDNPPMDNPPMDNIPIDNIPMDNFPEDDNLPY